MPIEHINYGAAPNDGTGDKNRDAWIKAEGNFVDLDSRVNAAIPLSQKGAANGVAPLNESGVVPAVNLPSYVDDVLEVATHANLPNPGEAGKIYIVLNDTGTGGTGQQNVQYRWTGSGYVELIASPGTTDNVPEGSNNLYFTAVRMLAALTANAAQAKTNLALNNVSNTSDANKPVSMAQQSALDLKFDKTGGSISGGVTISGGITSNNGLTVSTAAGTVAGLVLKSGAYQPQMRSNNGSTRLEWVNSAGSAYTALLTDAGIFSANQIKPFDGQQEPFLVNSLPVGYTGMRVRGAASGAFYPHVFWNSSNTTVGIISCSDTATSYGTSSDYRLKNDMGPVVGARDRVRKLRPITIEWKTVPGSREPSFFAHEVQAIIPHAVLGDKDAVDEEGKPIIQQLDKSAMIPDIVAALLEEMQLSDELRSAVDTLRSRIEALESK